MVVAVLVVSLVKPLAFSRYFVVVLPSVVPLVAVVLSMSPLNRWGRAVALVVVMVLLASWWGPGFAELDAAGGGEREQNQFRWISQRTSGLGERYSPRARLLNLSDQMEVAMGRVARPRMPGAIGISCAIVLRPSRCRRSCGWRAVVHRQQRRANSPRCRSGCRRRAIAAPTALRASAMCGCYSADLGPWPLRREVLGCAGWTGQQQRSAGLGIHHQLQQGLRR